MKPATRALASIIIIALAAPTPARADAPDVAQGLRWLAAAQASNGSWGNDNQLAITGMAGLALLASGSTPRRGPYAKELERALLFVLSCQSADGRAFIHSSSGYSAIHNHGYALLFLTQAYGECGGSLDARLKDAIARGVRATERSQRRNGGFSYFLYDKVVREHENMWRWDEASTTISQIQALRGAREAGFLIERGTIERAGDYIARSQHRPTGGFMYSIGSTPPRVSFEEGSEKPTFAITAAATAVLHALGTYDGPLVDRGVDYMEKFLPPTKQKVPFFYYGHYYAAQVMHMTGGPRGARWLDAVRGELATRQKSDGRFSSDEDSLSPTDSETLNTAWALQICLVDRGTLPVHER